jgi:hypothetical protein
LPAGSASSANDWLAEKSLVVVGGKAENLALIVRVRFENHPSSATANSSSAPSISASPAPDGVGQKDIIVQIVLSRPPHPRW